MTSDSLAITTNISGYIFAPFALTNSINISIKLDVEIVPEMRSTIQTYITGIGMSLI